MVSSRVLVVDDDPLVRKLIERLLRAAGHVAVVADCIAQAKGSIASDRPDVVVCDVGLQGESGLQLYRWLETVHPDLARRFVLITGDLDAEVASFVADTGVHVMEKPLQIRTLMQAVTDVAMR